MASWGTLWIGHYFTTLSFFLMLVTRRTEGREEDEERFALLFPSY